MTEQQQRRIKPGQHVLMEFSGRTFTLVVHRVWGEFDDCMYLVITPEDKKRLPYTRVYDIVGVECWQVNRSYLTPLPT